jgi:hypothetical protein
MLRAYHFVGDTLRNGQPIPPDGEWLEYDGELPVILCERGLHASVHPFDALKYAPGNTLCLVDLDGEIVADTDKHVATRRIIHKRIDADPILRAFACRCALDVIHLWNAPSVVREYLETGDESKRAAALDAARSAARASERASERDAAWAAARAAALDAARASARSAARAASWDASWAAAWAAAWEKYSGWFQEMVNEAFA